MFQLRDEHLKAFETVALDNFVERAVQHLRAELPRQTADYSDRRLRRRVRSCIDRCAAYGLTTEQQIIHFTETTFLLGKWFDSDPEQRWTKETLRDPELSPDERAALLAAVAELLFEQKEVNLAR
jgi:hypothetical protein